MCSSHSVPSAAPAPYPPSMVYHPNAVMTPPPYIGKAYWIGAPYGMPGYYGTTYYPPVPVVPAHLHTYMHQQSGEQDASPKPVLRADGEELDPSKVRKVQVQDSCVMGEEVAVEPAQTEEPLVASSTSEGPELEAPPEVVPCSSESAVRSRSLASRMLKSSQSASITSTPSGELPPRAPQPGMVVADFNLTSPSSPSSLRVSSVSPLKEPTDNPIPHYLVPDKFKGVCIGDEIKRALACERLAYQYDPSLTLDHRVSLGVIKEVITLALTQLKDGFRSEKFVDHPNNRSLRSQGKKIHGERALYFTVQKGGETKTLRAIFRNRMIAGRRDKESSKVNLVTAFYCGNKPTVGTIRTQRFYSDISEVR